MRPRIAVCALIAVAAAVPQALRTVLACAAGVVLEALPFLGASALLATLIGARARGFAAYLGCGCGDGPAARSLPAAVAAAALFGAPIALARVAAGAALSRIFPLEHHGGEDGELLAGLQRLAPAALAAGLFAAFVPVSMATAFPAPAAFFAGAAAGAVASPCALGGIALAASLRASSPWAAAGVLCTAGMIDLRLFHVPAWREDRYAYALLALVSGLAAAQHGAMLVHPRMTIPLAASGVLFAVRALRCPAAQASRAALAVPSALLAALALGAPVPAYTATETTLADAFAGERVTFMGLATEQRGRSALVRYAITCCRADAQPVALLLDRSVAPGEWMRANGTLIESDGGLRLRVARIERVAPPTDPFVYR